jgi:hypothetical protein
MRLSDKAEGAIMNTKTALMLSAILLGTTANAQALAGNRGGHVRFGVFIGAPFYPWYYPPYYYYPPAVVAVPVAPTTYIEQGSPQAAPAQQSYWYYCAESKTYYPYVKECPAGWQRVAPQPAPGG